MEDKKLDNAPEAAENPSEEGGNFNDNLHGVNLNDRVKVLSPGRTVAKRFFRSKLSVIGLVILLLLVLFCFVGPLFSPWGEKQVDFNVDSNSTIYVFDLLTSYYERDAAGNLVYDESGDLIIHYVYFVSETTPANNANAGISWDHWMGTDSHGWDIFTRLMYGGRVSLTIGFVVVIVETAIGVVLGGLAGYFGGWVDNLIMRIVDVLACIPSLPILLILSVVFDNITTIDKLYYMMLILSLMSWGGTARLVRGQILSLREQDFMLAAKCSGLSTSSKIFRHLIPNVIPQLIVSMTLGLGSVILMEATLGYLGLGAPLGTATWGTMIETASNMSNLKYYPNFWLGAGVCITLAVLAFNFVGDGLRDAFDPKMKR
ncbi:MAG: ABC transporter permease [Clostridia bacterium]|nr:ABC transporter permease [Clostridia bacterium]